MLKRLALIVLFLPMGAIAGLSKSPMPASVPNVRVDVRLNAKGELENEVKNLLLSKLQKVPNVTLTNQRPNFIVNVIAMRDSNDHPIAITTMVIERYPTETLRPIRDQVSTPEARGHLSLLSDPKTMLFRVHEHFLSLQKSDGLSNYLDQFVQRVNKEYFQNMHQFYRSTIR